MKESTILKILISSVVMIIVYSILNIAFTNRWYVKMESGREYEIWYPEYYNERCAGDSYILSRANARPIGAAKMENDNPIGYVRYDWWKKTEIKICGKT